MKRNLLAAAIALAGAMLTAGCAGGSFVVATGPPPPRYGVVGVAPGPGYVWTEGFYDRRGNDWVWMPGEWRRPPRRGRVWVSSAWVRSGNHWRLRRGHWR